jgi:hypothetical protein
MAPFLGLYSPYISPVYINHYHIEKFKTEHDGLAVTF